MSVEAALQALYEDASLRDELRDDEANELLKWAEAELVKLEGADEAVFDEKVGELRRLIRGMNRFVGRRADLSAQAGDESLAHLSQHADALGYALSPDQLAQFAANAAALDGVSAVQALARLINGAGTAPPADSPPNANPPPDLPASAAPPADSPASFDFFGWQPPADDAQST